MMPPIFILQESCMGWFDDNHPMGDKYMGGYGDFDGDDFEGEELDDDALFDGGYGHTRPSGGGYESNGSEDSDRDSADPYAREMEHERSDEYNGMERGFLQEIYPQLFHKPTTDVIDVDEEDEEDVFSTPYAEMCRGGDIANDMRLLVAVSGVCRSWRERSASLAPLHGVEC